MDELTDAELLRRYAEEGTEAAFGEVVRRRIDLVYAIARRQVGGDAQLAEDVTQKVFTDLARKARALAGREVLSGWLCRSAQFAASDLVRAERRRRAREETHEAMNDPRTETTGTEEAWEKLRPLLDELLSELGERDRDALALRFFEGRAWADIGERLRLSEEAARKRVERALERMRERLARRGVTSTGAALGVALANQVSAAAPAGLAASVTGAALAGGALAGGGAGAAVYFMSMTKLQIAVAAVVLAAGTGGLVWQHRTNTRLETENARWRAQEGELTRLRVENRRLSAEAAELAALRAEQAERSRAQAEAARTAKVATMRAATAAEKPASGGVALAAGLVPVETLGNVGRGTPRATFATQLWAARSGEVELEASVLTFGPEARARLAEVLATLPEAVRAQYGTPERLMAFVLAGSPHPVGGMEVVGESANGANEAVLQTRWQHADDAIVHQSEMTFRREADGWRWVVPMALVNRAAAYIERTQAGPMGAGRK